MLHPLLSITAIQNNCFCLVLIASKIGMQNAYYIIFLLKDDCETIAPKSMGCSVHFKKLTLKPEDDNLNGSIKNYFCVICQAHHKNLDCFFFAYTEPDVV